MTAACRLQTLIFSGTCGILITVGSVIIFKNNYITNFVTKMIQKECVLIEGSASYSIWSSPTHCFLKMYLFHVNNPEAVLQGEPPILTEKGPYVYDEISERVPMFHDEIADEILYTEKMSYTFNQIESGNLTEDDVVTILNPAYMGTINMLSGLPSNFMTQYGNEISNLFPPKNIVFVTGKVGDILFKGLKIQCNERKFPGLALICSTLKTSKPPIMRDGPRAGVYFYSFFDKQNGSTEGPYRVNRGSVNLTRLGNLSEFRGQRLQKIWNTDECNEVKGSDQIPWPPLAKSARYVTAFSAELCRPIQMDYKQEIIISRMKGSLFTKGKNMWESSEIDCYCPRENDEKQCLPKGLLDISKCQEVPILLSEPHFLYADPHLLHYAQGLSPREEWNNGHQTYIIIEPTTGIPLSGTKRTQLNMNVKKQPVELLGNISEGYFPIVWVEDGITPPLNVVWNAYQAQRALTLTWFIQIAFISIGVYILLITLYLAGIPSRKIWATNPVTDPVLIVSPLRQRSLTYRPPKQPRRVFE